MGCLSNIILDIDLELQRSLQGLETTRRSNTVTIAKTDHRNECKNNYLNGFLSAGEYLNAISLTIGRDEYILGYQPQVQDISDSLSDSNESAENSEHSHVCLFPRSENLPLLHDDNCVHGGFCKTCADRLMGMKADCPICRSSIKRIIEDFSITKVYLAYFN